MKVTIECYTLSNGDGTQEDYEQFCREGLTCEIFELAGSFDMQISGDGSFVNEMFRGMRLEEAINGVPELAAKNAIWERFRLPDNEVVLRTISENVMDWCREMRKKSLRRLNLVAGFRVAIDGKVVPAVYLDRIGRMVNDPVRSFINI
jgi:hypothetical protein